MEALLDILSQYAEENLIPRLLREYTPQIQEARIRMEQLENGLNSLHPGAEVQVEHLRAELNRIHFCREQAFLLSGLSIGLALGRI